MIEFLTKFFSSIDPYLFWLLLPGRLTNTRIALLGERTDAVKRLHSRNIYPIVYHDTVSTIKIHGRHYQFEMHTFVLGQIALFLTPFDMIKRPNYHILEPITA
jgi:hypothetical protein